jgi:O-antigen ligase
MKITNNFFLLFFMIVPILLITGPALPDISITLCALFFLFNFIILKKDYIFLKDNFFLVSIIFWFSIIFISFFAFDKTRSFQDSIIFIRLLIIPTIAYFLFFNNEDKLTKIITIIFVCVVFVVIDTLFQFFNYTSELGFQNDILGFSSDWYGRLTGPFGKELIPGAYVSKFGLLGYLFFLFIKKNKYLNFLEISYLGLIGLVCFASGERMALATYFLALFFLLIFLKNKRIVFFFSISLSIFLIAITIIFHPFYNDYKVINSTHLHQGLTIEKHFDCPENTLEKCNKIIKLQPSFIKVLQNFSSSAYGEIYKVGLSMFIDYPITGVGISNYQTVCNNISKYKTMMINYDCASHPHNLYIQWLSEGGIITFASFLFLLLSILYFIFYGCNNKIFKYVSIACILILFWPIMSTGSLIKNWNGVLTFYIIGICISLNRVKINK